MNAQFRKGVVELCVLSLIIEKDRYGYELVECISEQIDITEGTIYPILRRFTKDKWCKSYLRESQEGPPRKYYKITTTGMSVYKKQLNDWLDFNNSIRSLLKIGESNEQKRVLR
jgi:PadR family transcriptional regulator PadR